VTIDRLALQIVKQEASLRLLCEHAVSFTIACIWLFTLQVTRLFWSVAWRHITRASKQPGFVQSERSQCPVRPSMPSKSTR
jgi:hypothetical protein